MAALGCVLVAVACAASPSAEPWPGLDAEPSPRLTVLSTASAGDPDNPDAFFFIATMAAIPDGTIAVRYDPHAPGNGDEETVGAPRVSILGSDGSLTPVVPGAVNGQEVDPAEAGPVAAGPRGTLYLWDQPAGRIVAGVPGGVWREVVNVDGSGRWGRLRAAIGPDGALP